MRIRGKALVDLIVEIPDYLTADYQAVAWEAFRRVRESGHSVQFPDILVILDEKRGIDNDLSRSLRLVTKLLDRVETSRLEQRRRLQRATSPDVLDPVEVTGFVDSSLDDPKPVAVEVPVRGMGLLDSLRTESRIRIYVETGSNKGHQSASVTLARKLIRWMKGDGKQTINKKMVIEFRCNDKDAKAKAISIIGNNGKSLEGVKTEVTTFGYGIITPTPVNYAFSGAIDAPLTTFERLEAKCLIALQPIGWAGGAEMVVAQGANGPKFMVLTKASQLITEPVTDLITFPAPFNRLPFTESADKGASKWSPSDLSDRLVAMILDRAQSSQSTDNPIFVCPLYGMGDGQPMENYGAPVWINIANALLTMAAGGKFKGGIILLNLSKDLGHSPSGTWGRVEQAFEGDDRVRIEKQGLSIPVVGQILDQLSDGLTLCICTVLDNKDGRTMDRAYRESRLPPIFEGQGSLTQVVSMGRPFIKLSMRASVDESWPSDYLPISTFEGMDVRLQRISNTIVDDWSKRKAAKCQAQLADLFWEMFDDSSDVWGYFRACRAMATDARFDRLCWAAEALARLLTPSKKVDEVLSTTSLNLGFPSSSVSKGSKKLEATRQKSEWLFIQSIGSRFSFVDNPGGGDCLYYAFDDGLNGRTQALRQDAPPRLSHATDLRKRAALETGALIRSGFGLTVAMFQGIQAEGLGKAMALIPEAMKRLQGLHDTFFQVAKIEFGMGVDEVFAADNDPKMLAAQRMVSGMVRSAIARDVELEGWLDQIATAYEIGQGRPSEWAGELEYYGLVITGQINLRIHYADRGLTAIQLGRTHCVTEYRYHEIVAEWQGQTVNPAVLTIDILHINDGTHYVLGVPR